MLTDQQIDKGKKEFKPYYSLPSPTHQSNDCIRLAYEWLDAQIKTKSIGGHVSKHEVERWCGRYISVSDIELAAFLHPDINGIYPNYNISKRKTDPSIFRLLKNPEAFLHGYRDSHNPDRYARKEDRPL